MFAKSLLVSVAYITSCRPISAQVIENKQQFLTDRTQNLVSSQSQVYSDRPAYSHSGRWHKVYLWSVAALVAGNAMDIASSYGAQELNPMLRGSDGRFGNKAVGIKIGGMVGIVILEKFVLTKERDRAIVNIVGAGVWSGIAVRNWKIQQEKTRRNE